MLCPVQFLGSRIRTRNHILLFLHLAAVTAGCTVFEPTLEVIVTDPSGAPTAGAAVYPVTPSLNGPARITDDAGKAVIPRIQVQEVQWVGIVAQGFRDEQVSVPGNSILRITLMPQPVNAGTILTASLALARYEYEKDDDVELTVVLTNKTSYAIILPAQVLETATLLVEIRDGKSRQVIPTVPPSVPRSDKATFASQERRSAKVTLGVFSPPLPSGEYTVVPRAAVAIGNPVSFRIR
jgi:hypothetical protein